MDDSSEPDDSSELDDSIASDHEPIVDTINLSISINAAYEVFSCGLCGRRFDNETPERTPRVLLCGHMFCTQCIGNGIKLDGTLSSSGAASASGSGTLDTAARRDWTWSFVCPRDAETTPVANGDASKLAKCLLVKEIMAMRRLSDPLPLRLWIKMLGGEMFPLTISSDALVEDVKLEIFAKFSEYDFPRQHLFILDQGGVDLDPPLELKDERTLESYGLRDQVTSVSVIVLIMSEERWECMVYDVRAGLLGLAEVHLKYGGADASVELWTRALSWARDNTDGRDPVFASCVAFCHEHGLGGAEVNEHLAADWYQRAVDKGDLFSLTRLAGLCFRVFDDLTRGIELLRRAADQGFPDALY